MRAIRYALEAAPVEVLAIDRSGEACQGTRMRYVVYTWYGRWSVT